MIRAIALFSAAWALPAGAQGIDGRALTEACGGTRVLFEWTLPLLPGAVLNPEEHQQAADALQARADPIIPFMQAVYFEDGGLAVYYPVGGPEEGDFERLVARPMEFGFYQVLEVMNSVPEEMAPQGELVYPSRDEEGIFYRLAVPEVLNQSHMAEASADFDQNGRPAVAFRFNDDGAEIFGAYTEAHVGEPFAITLDFEVISAPTIQSPIYGGSGIITGNFTLAEAEALANLIGTEDPGVDLTVSTVESLPGTGAEGISCPNK